VRAAVGRTFLPGEDEGGARVALLGHGLWQRRFGGTAAAVGSVLRLDGEPHEVVGVLPPDLRFPAEAELWVPGRGGVPFSSPVLGGVPVASVRDSHILSIVGRLRSGVSAGQADAEMQSIAASLARAHPTTNEGLGARVAGLREHLFGDQRPALVALAGAVGLVLLIVCANLAGLLLARATQRRREHAVRLALGASPGRLLRAALAEALLLSTAGGALGVLLAVWALDAASALAGAALPSAPLDARVLSLAVTLTGATALLFGLLPAREAARSDPAASLHEGARASGGPSRARLRRLLVTGEVALAEVLLVGAGLLLVSLARLSDVDPGFTARRVLTFRVSLPAGRYATGEQRRALYDAVLERAARLPGVEAAGAVMRLPLAGGPVNRGLRIEHRPEPGAGEDHSIDYQLVSPSYFDTLGIAVRRGRGLSAADVEGAPRVVVINQAAARRYWPGQDPVGQRVGLGDGDDVSGWRTVVGIVADVRHHALHRPAQPAAFAPYAQDRERWNAMSFALRTSVPPESLGTAVLSLVRDVDPQQPVAELRSLADLRCAAVGRPRALAGLLAAFAAVAVLLAAVGVYGLIAFTTAQRAQELGVRSALGASPRALRALVLGEGLRLGGLGVLLGLSAALACAPVLRTLLFEVRPSDPATLAAVSLALTAIAASAAYLPARRAAAADPMQALRSS
jgi:predicted permease